MNKELEEMLKQVYEDNKIYCKNREDFENLKKIIKAMSVVDRKFFVSYDPYVNIPLPIGEGQTISQPTTVARILILSKLSEGMEVLDVGSGSGWNASLVAYLTKSKVISIERISKLKDLAEKNFENLRKNVPEIKNLEIDFLLENIFDKKSVIWKKEYDRIIFSAAINSDDFERIIEIAENLLKKEGLLVVPTAEFMNTGPIAVIKKEKKLKIEKTSELYSFVPLLDGIE